MTVPTEIPCDAAPSEISDRYISPHCEFTLSAGDVDELAAENLVKYLEDQREATGAIPDDRTIVVERFRDEIGDWRVAVLSPFGGQVHAPWALCVAARMRERFGATDERSWKLRFHAQTAGVSRAPDSGPEARLLGLGRRPGRNDST